MESLKKIKKHIHNIYEKSFKKNVSEVIRF